MTNFRNKIAVILVDSELNDDNIRNRDLETDDGNTDPMDFVIVVGPSKNIETSQSLVFSPSANPKRTQEDLIDDICLYISMTDDVLSLE